MRDCVRCYIHVDDIEAPFILSVPYIIVALLQARGVPVRGVWMGKS